MTRTGRWIAALAAMTGVVALAGGLAWASSGKGWKDWGRHGPGYGALEMFDQFDRDGDGRVTRAEAEQFRNDRLAKFDADGDGNLSLEEYKALWMDAMQRMMVRAFQRHDADGDGRVTKDEFAGPIDRMFARLDRNGDGAVTREELMRRGHREERREHRRWGDDD